MKEELKQHIKELKQVKSALVSYVQISLPMIEECHDADTFPIAVIGVGKLKDGKVGSHIATLHDDHDKIVYNICKAFVEQAKDKYDPTPPI